MSRRIMDDSKSINVIRMTISVPTTRSVTYEYLIRMIFKMTKNVSEFN
jgi:hypothetical protein